MDQDARKQSNIDKKKYRIVTIVIPTTKIDLKKREETKEKIVIQNVSIYTKIKIESIFWLSILKKDKCTLFQIIDINNAKINYILIIERLVLDQILYKCMRYNLVCRMKQYFKCYKYDHVLVYC